MGLDHRTRATFWRADGAGGPAARTLGWAAVLGPGLLVMLADTDVGSVVTAAQSGAQWGYRLLLLQFLLVPALYVSQELVARLGLATGRGCARLIEETYGAPLAWLAAGALALSCFAALLAQIGGLAGVGVLFGAPRGLTIALAVFVVLAAARIGSYRSIERIAIGLGLLELAFLVVAWRSAPDPAQMLGEAFSAPLSNSSFVYLAAANIGATIMPWTLFYQQSAVAAKGLGPSDAGRVRADTFAGAVLCQIITAAILITAASGLRDVHADGLTGVGAIVRALEGWLGSTVGRSIFALGLVGSAMAATIVICLALAWTIDDIAGARGAPLRGEARSGVRAALFTGFLVAGGFVVWLAPDAIGLAIGAAVINAILLPPILMFIFGLARTRLPPPLRLRPFEAVVVGATLAITGALALLCGIVGFLS